MNARRKLVAASGDARKNRDLILTDGLFTLNPDQQAKLEVFREHGDRLIVFRGPDRLDETDQKVLVGLTALATRTHRSAPKFSRLDAKASPEAQAAFDALSTPTDRRTVGAPRALTVALDYTVADIAREVGMQPSGTAYRVIARSLRRLFQVSVLLFLRSDRKPPKDGVYRPERAASDDDSGYEPLDALRLLAVDHLRVGRDGTLSTAGRSRVILNPILVTALLGESDYSIITMGEYRRLSRPATRLAYIRLCGFVDRGRDTMVSERKLASYVYGRMSDAEWEGAKETYLKTVRRVLDDLRAIGWRVSARAGSADNPSRKIRRPEAEAGDVSLQGKLPGIPAADSETLVLGGAEDSVLDLLLGAGGAQQP